MKPKPATRRNFSARSRSDKERASEASACSRFLHRYLGRLVQGAGVVSAMISTSVSLSPED